MFMTCRFKSCHPQEIDGLDQIFVRGLDSDHFFIRYYFERRSRSDCVHEQVAKRIANVRFTCEKRMEENYGRCSVPGEIKGYL